jgi:transcriptional regulator with XRE-family HTH domain
VKIGDRLKALRVGKNLTQGDVEKRTGMLRCYVSRVEHGHTIPSVETLEKFARALEVPLYQLFYEGDKPPALPSILKRVAGAEVAWGGAAGDSRMLAQFRRMFSRMSERDLRMFFSMAQKLAVAKRH